MNRSRSQSEAPTERGRWSSRRKTEVVLRLLRGAALAALSRALGVTAATLALWRARFLVAGQAGCAVARRMHTMTMSPGSALLISALPRKPSTAQIRLRAWACDGRRSLIASTVCRGISKIGELTMENELLREGPQRPEAGHPLASRRSKP
jgi:transposase-like protein